LVDALRVLARKQAAGKAEEAGELVVHLVHDVRGAVLALGVRVRPGSLQRSAYEVARAPLRLHPFGLLDVERLFDAARKVEMISIPGADPGRAVIKPLDLRQVGRPFRSVRHILLHDRPDARRGCIDVHRFVKPHPAIINFSA
jgi:hypothetical protein